MSPEKEDSQCHPNITDRYWFEKGKNIGCKIRGKIEKERTTRLLVRATDLLGTLDKRFPKLAFDDELLVRMNDLKREMAMRRRKHGALRSEEEGISDDD